MGGFASDAGPRPAGEDDRPLAPTRTLSVAAASEACVDGPLEARAKLSSGAAVGCGHLSGLLVRRRTSGPDAIRGVASDRFRAFGEARLSTGSASPPGSTDVPSRRLCPHAPVTSIKVVDIGDVRHARRPAARAGGAVRGRPLDRPRRLGAGERLRGPGGRAAPARRVRAALAHHGPRKVIKAGWGLERVATRPGQGAARSLLRASPARAAPGRGPPDEMCWRRAAFGSLPPDAPVEGAATLPGAQLGRRSRAARSGECPAVARRCRGALHATTASAKPPAVGDLIVLFCALHLPDAADAGLVRARLADVTRLATAFDPHAESSRARLYHGGMRWRPARSPTPTSCGGRGPAPGAARPGRRPAGRGPRPRPCRRRGGGRGGPARRAALAGGG